MRSGIRAVLAEVMRRNTEGRAPLGLRVERVEISLRSEHTRRLGEAICSVNCREPISQPIYFRHRHGVPVFTELSVMENAGAFSVVRRANTAVIQPLGHQSLTSLRAKARVEWRGISEAAFIWDCPLMTPQPVVGSQAGRQAEIVIGEHGENLRVLGIPCSPESRSVLHEPALQLVVTANEAARQVDDAVWMGSAVSSDLREAGASLLGRDVARMLIFLAEYFGLARGLSVLLTSKHVAEEPPWIGTGCRVQVDANEFATVGTDWVVAEHNLVRQLATIWWGHGCRLVGNQSVEMQWAIATLAALAWTRETGSRARLQPLLAHYRRLASMPALQARWHAMQGVVDNRRLARLVLSLNRDLENGGNLRAIRALTRSAWGHFVSADVALRSLWPVGEA